MHALEEKREMQLRALEEERKQERQVKLTCAGIRRAAPLGFGRVVSLSVHT